MSDIIKRVMSDIINPFEKPRATPQDDIVEGQQCFLAFGVIPVPNAVGNGFEPAGVHAPCKRSCKLFDKEANECSIVCAISEVRSLAKLAKKLELP